MREDNKYTARMFKAFCDENRLCILDLLRSGELCACELLEELNISQSTLSHHMKILVDSGMVMGRKDGKWMHYSLSKDGISVAQNYLQKYLTADKSNSRKSNCVTCS